MDLLRPIDRGMTVPFTSTPLQTSAPRAQRTHDWTVQTILIPVHCTHAFTAAVIFSASL
jgi:hypothetical protein